MVNQLQFIDQFKDILKSYQPSDSTRKILNDVNFCLFLGPSAAGRSTIIKELQKLNGYHFIVSDTTRQPRFNDGILEQNGIEYWFRKEEDFLTDLKKGLYLEAEIIHNQQVSGISVRELKKAQKSLKIAVSDIDLGGVDSVLAIKPDAKCFIILPPSFEIWLERLTSRDVISKDEIIRRMKTAIDIFDKCLYQPNFQIIINNDFKSTVTLVDQLCRSNVDNHKNSSIKIELLSTLLLQTRQYVNQFGTLDT